jgi:hypothetical protein
MSQSNTEVASHAIVASVRTIPAPCLRANCHTTSANANSPTLPMAEPAASTLAASLPRSVPCNPSFSFFCTSCFSISVAPAGKMAGKAKKSPPRVEPNFFAMMPAAAVINPPRRNRTAYSCHFVCLKLEGSTWICILRSTTRARAQAPQQTRWELRKV